MTFKTNIRTLSYPLPPQISFNTREIPPFYFERWQIRKEIPLGAYGCELMKIMQRDYPERYWQLSFEGRLVSLLREREAELADMKFILMTEIEKKFPRPKTDDFLTIAAHMSQIDEEAETIIKKELLKPI